MAKVKINNHTFDSIIVKSLNIDTTCMEIPKEWESYKSQWSEQENGNHGCMPQILIGSDCAILFPKTVCDKDGKPVETSSAQLLQSVITGKYLAHSFLPPNIQVEVNAQAERVVLAVAHVSTARAVRPVPINPDDIEMVAEDIITLINSDSEDDTDDIVELAQVYVSDGDQLCNTLVQFNTL